MVNLFHGIPLLNVPCLYRTIKSPILKTLLDSSVGKYPKQMKEESKLDISNYGVQFLDVREPVETREWKTQTWGYSSLEDARSDAKANADMCRRKDSPVFIFRVIEIDGEYSEGYFEALELFI